MSIDAVIAQARRPGNFSERRRFTIARTQAIQKLRQFSLADSSAYILELIQSAIGNGAVSIDIHQDGSSLTLAYIGGGLPEAALTRLFDYLFAAKDRTDIGPYRDLAHGINAMLARDPTRIVVESGDGTKEGTTRLELHAGSDRFDVGRPDHTLTGTFVRAEGMSSAGRERALVESRCRLAPIPIVFNSESLFGFSTRKIPSLPGYAKTMVFDEGDLFGILGHDNRLPKPTFELLTRGVIIEELEQVLVENAKMGGVINFDALHKTADHARIVRDDRLAEMWLRLRPYALALARGETSQPSVLDIQVWGGPQLGNIAQIRGFLHEAKRVVVAPRATQAGSTAIDVAIAIAEALDATVILCKLDQVRALRLLAGGRAAIYTPDLTTAVDLEFYTSGPAPLPPRPWIVQPVDVPATPAVDLRPLLVSAAGGHEPIAAAILAQLGDSSEIRARVYTPAAADDPTTAEVHLFSAGRLLCTTTVPSRHGGHVLVAELPDVSPTVMLRPTANDGPPLAVVLAAALLVHADETLGEAASRAIAGLAHRDGPLRLVEAHRALEVLARTAVLQFRHRRGDDGGLQPALNFALLEPGPPGVDLLGLPVLPTHHGEPIALRALADAMTASGGRIHLEHSDPAPALRLDRTLLPLVASIVGAAALASMSLGTGAKGPVLAAIDQSGRHHPLDAVRRALAGGRRLTVDHRPAIPPEAPPGDEIDGDLSLTPAAFLALARDGVVSSFDFDFHESAFVLGIPIRTAEVDGVLGITLASAPHPAVVVLDEHRSRVHRYVELAHDFGVVGVLRLRAAGWSEGLAAVIASTVAAATGELYDQLLARLPGWTTDSPRFARAAAAMLNYAGRRIDLVADPHGRVAVRPVQATADRVLALPLFPGRRGLPLAAWHLVHRFAEAGGDVRHALAELDAAALPPVLRDWLAAVLDPARIARSDVPAAPAPRTPGHLALARNGDAEPIPDLAPGTPLDPVTLAATLEYWLHTLRPDLPAARRPWDRRGHVLLLLEGDDDEPEFARVTDDDLWWTITLQPRHWLLRWAVARGQADRQPIAWLLLACYARINEHLDDVTNQHEGQFQRAVADALELGRLDLVTPRLD